MPLTKTLLLSSMTSPEHNKYIIPLLHVMVNPNISLEYYNGEHLFTPLHPQVLRVCPRASEDVCDPNPDMTPVILLRAGII
ncbi:hypothetical protein TNCT_179011 [Trichonephila clavata]|uniref:Uncharacterized protein n=1 Tax=Trichonephila clavata TaxID=2740835 RepID=A0A8X6LYL9_TRICU|nr:hypothetical protein TNCT_179011 [Trichonephila clavata]